MVEGDRSYAALVKWSQRYPQYRDRLAKFFADWAVQELYAELPEDDELPDIDEERLVQKGVEFAMDILRRQGRLLPETPVELPAEFGQLVLTAIYLLPGRAPVASITSKVGEMSGREVLAGSIYLALNGLENKGLVRGVDAD